MAKNPIVEKSKKRILIVDDERHITDLLRALLQLSGFNVIQSQNGAQCLKEVELVIPDLIILDIKMPVMDGWQVCEKLKSEDRTKKIPVIILSAYAGKEDRQKSLDLGADQFIAKPFEVPVLLKIVEKLIRGK